MATFLTVGSLWINLDLVTSIEVHLDPTNPNLALAATIYFSTGQSRNFQAPADVQALFDWLRNHRAS